MLALQRAAGNRSARDLIGSHGNRNFIGLSQHHCLPVSRQQHGEDTAESESEDPRIAVIEGLRNLLQNTLTWQARGYENDLEAARSSYGALLGSISVNYQSAWGRHECILSSAGEAAQDENVIRGVVVGALASGIVAMALATIPAVGALEAFSAGWWATTAGEAGAGSVIGGLGGQAFAAPTGFTAAVPERLAELQQLRQLLHFERTTSRAHAGVANLGRKMATVDTILD